MPSEIIYVDRNSEIPLYGLDFIGIIDRGTNILEIKPLTQCNLICKYCFVSAGDYITNFIVDVNYLIENIVPLIEIKGKHDIEIHIAPYGEILLYKDLIKLIKKLKLIDGIYKISMQTNGLLLSKKSIIELEKAGLSQINISLNTLDQDKAEYLSNYKGYQLQHLLAMIDFLIESKIDLVIAPVLIPKVNDQDIEELIRFIQNFQNKVILPNKIRIGIQKYLIYKTGRRIKKIRPKSWGFFYKQLNTLEKKHNMKLKLGPRDFGIHKRKSLSLPIQKGNLVKSQIISIGRWDTEYIAKIDDNWGIKVLLNKTQKNIPLIGKKIDIKIIKSKQKENLLTGIIEN